MAVEVEEQADRSEEVAPLRDVGRHLVTHGGDEGEAWSVQ